MRETVLLSYRKLNFEIELEKRITIISGDSATGKSLLYKTIEAHEGLNSKDKFLTINHRNTGLTSVGFRDMLRGLKDKIIIIDNSDIILNDSMKEFINYDEDNKYIILGRKTEGIRTTPNSLASIYYDKKRRDLNLTINIEIKCGEYVKSGYDYRKIKFKSSYSNLSRDIFNK